MHYIEQIILIAILIAVLTDYGRLISLYLLLGFKKRIEPDNGYWPFVSILKPVRGIDSNAYANFETFCRLNYPKYELIFAVAEQDDPVIPIINRLVDAYPNVRIRLVISEDSIGENPKINNLQNAYLVAKGDVILISDSDVMADVDYLRNVALPLKDRSVGIITSVVMQKGAQGFWGSISTLLVNGGVGGLFAILDQFGLLNVAYGPSIAMRREVLDKVGGFRVFANYIGEDIVMGEVVKANGYKIKMQKSIVTVFKSSSSRARELSQVFRWLVVLKKHAPIHNMLVPSFFAAFLALIYLLISRSSLAILVLFLAIFTRLLYTILIERLFVKEPRVLKYIWTVPIGILIFVSIWFCALFSSRVTWRGNIYKLYKAGRISRIGKAKKAGIEIEGSW